jgi:ATP-dependent exoDNAse (exonuclease V) beta subunit
MTVHQAKGLEFDIVVLPQLDDSIFGGGREVPALAHRSERGGPVTAVFPSVPREMRYLFPEIEAAHQEQKGAVLRDGLSTLYVAITRPRYALHCIVHPDGESGPGTAITPARILREALRDPFSPLPPAAGAVMLYESGSVDWHLGLGAEPEFPLSAEYPPLATFAFPLPLASRRARNLKRETPSQLTVGAIDVRNLLRIDNTAAKSRGVVVHAWFEKIGWVEDELPQESELIDIARRIGPDLPEDQIHSLLANFRGWVRNPAIRAALSRARYPQGAVVERELSFMRRHGDALMEGVIDRLVLTQGQGKPVGAEIFDFKTDRTPQSPDRLASFVSHYRPQLEAYVDAVSEMYDIPRTSCRAFLILLRGGKVVPVAT